MSISMTPPGGVVFWATLGVFTVEALLHYNIGKSGLKSMAIPPLKDIVKIVAVVMLFSWVNERVIEHVSKSVDAEEHRKKEDAVAGDENFVGGCACGA